MVKCGSRRCKRKPIIGLAGGIGAGKSLVAKILTECGAGLIDSDAIGRALLAEPEVADTLRGWWGEEIFDAEGRVDRRRVGDKVFADSVQRARLERLLYPRIAREREAAIARYEADPAVGAIVLDSPLLFESGLSRVCDTIWFVEAEEAVRVRRVADSRGWSRAELDRREQWQKPLELKRANADYILVNNSDMDDLRLQVVHLFQRVLERATHKKP